MTFDRRMLLVALLCVAGCGKPQMGPSEEAFRAVDALYTAVTARDAALVTQCETRLHALRNHGELPADASDYLDRVIAKTRSGAWQPAAEDLYAFMSAQRREGPREHPEKKGKRK